MLQKRPAKLYWTIKVPVLWLVEKCKVKSTVAYNQILQISSRNTIHLKVMTLFFFFENLFLSWWHALVELSVKTICLLSYVNNLTKFDHEKRSQVLKVYIQEGGKKHALSKVVFSTEKNTLCRLVVMFIMH